MEDRERMAAEAVAIYEELFETFKERLSSDPEWTESRMHELMDATFEEVRGLNLPGVSTSDEVIVRSSTALAQLMADAVFADRRLLGSARLPLGIRRAACAPARSNGGAGACRCP